MATVLRFKRKEADTILTGVADPKARTLVDRLLDLDLPLVQTPIDIFAGKIELAAKNNRALAVVISQEVLAGKTKPKPAKLNELLTASSKLFTALSNVSREHRKIVVSRTRAVADRLSKGMIIDGAGRREAATALQDFDAVTIAELLKEATRDVCSDPRPLTKAQARIKLRKHAVHGILDAYKAANYSMPNFRDLTVAARLLSPLFAAEASLVAMEKSTVRDIRSKWQGTKKPA